MAKREPKLILCPYCGATQPRQSAQDEVSGRCLVCGGLFEPLSRKATQIAMGPWFIRDKRNPFRPGCSFEVLKRQIESGRIKPTTVIRGPSTRQFWSLARNVPGVAHLLGYCHRCGAHVRTTDAGCPECAEPMVEPGERNELGLLYPTKTAAESAQQALDEAIRTAQGPSATEAASGATSSSDTATGTTVTMLSAEAEPTKPAGALPRPGGKAPPSEPGDDLLSQVFAESGTEMVSRADALRTRPTSRPVQSPRALDFTPGPTPALDESVDEDAVKANAAPNAAHAHSPLVWALLAVNVVVLMVLIALGIVFFSHNRAPAPSAPPRPAPTHSTPNAAAASPSASPASASSPAYPALTPAVPQAPAQEHSRATDAADARADHPDRQADAPSAPQAVMTQIPQSVVTALERVADLERQGKPIEALNYMEQIEKQTTAQQRPRDFNQHLQRLRAQVDNRQPAQFFNVPTEE